MMMAKNIRPKKKRSGYSGIDLEQHRPRLEITGDPDEGYPEGVGSTNEGRLWIALRKAGWPENAIEIQTPILGGRSKRGGQVVDFVLYTPTPIPIEVDGNWWHRDSGDELISQAHIMQVFGREAVVFNGYETDSIDHAVAAVLSKIGRA